MNVNSQYEHTPNKAPIGVFDSGVGGLSVLKSLQIQFPNESFIYLGDTARLPYGTKSAENIIEYSLKACHFFNDMGVKSIVIACHTASSCALPKLRETFPHLIINGMIETCAQYASHSTAPSSVLVFGTEGTVKSQCYEKTIAAFNPERSVITQACGLLVALAEENWTTGKVPENIVQHYLNEVEKAHPEQKIDSLILGCTHFPILFDIIRRILPDTIDIIDPSKLVAEQLHQILSAKNLLSPAQFKQTVQFFVTDNKERFKQVADYFLGNQGNTLASSVELISLETAFAEKMKDVA